MMLSGQKPLKNCPNTGGSGMVGSLKRSPRSPPSGRGIHPGNAYIGPSKLCPATSSWSANKYFNLPADVYVQYTLLQGVIVGDYVRM
jgi:hypothetical protein